MSYRRKLVAGSVLAGAGLLSAAGMAFALWTSNAAFAGGRVTAGDFNLTYGEASWRQVTPGVTDPASGALKDGPGDFVSMPGDVIEVVIPVTTTLQGDNLNAKMLVDAGAAAFKDIEAGTIVAGFRVENEAGEQAGPESGEAKLGESITVKGLVSSDVGVTVNWQVIVTVRVVDFYRWTEQKPLLDLTKWDVGGVNVSLQQVREGPGFVESGDQQ
ncbi:hypothetical protein G7066_12810 [Leucobacter coleopterorum]|uniref:Alternate signal-mediated exported protein, RER_14450 family n=1 Tax=Leucobacter coleopterorum TaxID=2714933 RepID=A0ABX6K286_9MICO|nr:hypothetical protein [Leucobacter coleopterorum]QIM19229.1 hypothetical protein G7066_12810 [Leucobacter coleopterorum]